MPTSSLTYFTYSASTTKSNVQPSTSSIGDVIVIESLKPSPTPQEASTNPVPHSAQGAITVAAVLASISVVIVGAALVMVTAIVICRKPSRRRHLGRNDSMINNAIYGTTTENNMAATSRRGDSYDYPRFGLRLLKSIRGKKPTSAVHNDTTVAAFTGERPGNDYTMDFSSQRNEAYGTSLSSVEDDFEYSYVRYL